jgi:hypothetical protein
MRRTYDGSDRDEVKRLPVEVDKRGIQEFKPVPSNKDGPTWRGHGRGALIRLTRVFTNLQCLERRVVIAGAGSILRPLLHTDIKAGAGECGFRFIPAGYSDVKPATVPI